MENLQELYPLGVPLRVRREQELAALPSRKELQMQRFEIEDHSLPQQKAKPAPATRADGWLDGEPPCVGWWNASTRENEEFFRHWNGERWSRGTDNPLPRPSYRAEIKQQAAELPDSTQLRYRLVRAVWDVDPLSGGYHPWPGGDRLPVPPDTMVQVLLRDGETPTRPAHDFRWRWIGSGGDIVGYKVRA